MGHFCVITTPSGGPILNYHNQTGDVCREMVRDLTAEAIEHRIELIDRFPRLLSG
jgi:hypothetical protein